MFNPESRPRCQAGTGLSVLRLPGTQGTGACRPPRVVREAVRRRPLTWAHGEPAGGDGRGPRAHRPGDRCGLPATAPARFHGRHARHDDPRSSIPTTVAFAGQADGGCDGERRGTTREATAARRRPAYGTGPRRFRRFGRTVLDAEKPRAATNLYLLTRSCHHLWDESCRVGASNNLRVNDPGVGDHRRTGGLGMFEEGGIVCTVGPARGRRRHILPERLALRTRYGGAGHAPTAPNDRAGTGVMFGG